MEIPESLSKQSISCIHNEYLVRKLYNEKTSKKTYINYISFPGISFHFFDPKKIYQNIWFCLNFNFGSYNNVIQPKYKLNKTTKMRNPSRFILEPCTLLEFCVLNITGSIRFAIVCCTTRISNVNETA